MSKQTAIKLKVEVGADHTIRLPDEVPMGPVELIVLVDEVVDVGRIPGTVEGRPRVASPRLAHREQLGDFEMTVSDESPSHG